MLKCLYIYVYIYIYVYMYICIYVYMYIYIYRYKHMFMYIWIHIYIYRYVYIDRLFASWPAGCAVRIRQLWSGHKPGRTELVSPNRLRPAPPPSLENNRPWPCSGAVVCYPISWCITRWGVLPNQVQAKADPAPPRSDAFNLEPPAVGRAADGVNPNP